MRLKKKLGIVLAALSVFVAFPAANASAADPLISTGKTATASTQENTTNTPAKAFDQNTATRWASVSGSDPQWLQVDLGASYRVSQVKLNWEAAYASGYRVEVSDNASTWTQVYSTTTGDGGIDTISGLDAVGRYVRVFGTARATPWGYSLWEMEVYGSAPLSTGKTATASSQENTTNTPAKAFDQNRSTRWASVSFADPQWIQVDLGASYNIQHVRLDWEAAYASSYRVEVSNDASNWTQVYSTTTGNGGYDDLPGLSATGRYVRVFGTVRATPWGYSLFEVEVYGTPASTPPDTAISSVTDLDSPTLIDEDGNGAEAVQVTFTGTNSPTGFTCAMSGATTIAPTACTSPWGTIDVPQIRANVGENTVTVTASNAGGADPTPATYTFTMCPAAGCNPPPPSPQCSDGLDNDGDTLTDYPADPGCSSTTDNDETNAGGGGGSDPSGQAMPVGDIPGWHQIAADNFPYNVSTGNFPAGSGGKWGCYPDGWQDTSHNGIYNCTKVASVHDGQLDMFIHSENGTHYVAVPILNLPGGLDRQYGRYAVRFKADALPHYKTAWLLWPQSNVWPRDGEIDFPEGNLDSTISAFMHKQGATSGGDQDGYSTNVTYTNWHTAVIEWTATHCKFILDGVTIGDSTSRIPNTPMHWVLQTETSLDGVAPANSTQGHVYVDWATVYSPA